MSFIFGWCSLFCKLSKAAPTKSPSCTPSISNMVPSRCCWAPVPIVPDNQPLWLGLMGVVTQSHLEVCDGYCSAPGVLKTDKPSPSLHLLSMLPTLQSGNKTLYSRLDLGVPPPAPAPSALTALNINSRWWCSSFACWSLQMLLLLIAQQQFHPGSPPFY